MHTDDRAIGAESALTPPATLDLTAAPAAMDLKGGVLSSLAPANDGVIITPTGNLAMPWQVALAGIQPAARQAFDQPGLHAWSKRVRFTARALRHFRTWRTWYSFLQTSRFAAIGRFFPRLAETPFRPYLHKDMRTAERARVLLEHYDFIGRYTPAALQSALLQNQPFLLNEACLPLQSEALLINLTYAKHMKQEGELSLSLGRTDSLDTHREHAWIASLTFSVRRRGESWVIVVGGLQGGHAETGRDDARAATDVFHGLRPKPLLVHVLRQLATCWDIESIYGITNEAHCFMRRRYRGRISIKSSYDELWAEQGGQWQADGYYRLPVQVARRDLQDVPSRKRSQYRRRYALLDSLDQEIQAKLTP